MKIYSFILLLKKISGGCIIMFFINFIICWILQSDFHIMVYCTLPFAVITFCGYCVICITENFIVTKKCSFKNNKNIIKRQNFKEFEEYTAC